jgi:hypothetical protein
VSAERLENFDIEKYLEIGGRLDKEHLSEVLPKWPEIRQKQDLIDKSRHSFISAESMADDCLDVIPEQKILYVFLRDTQIRGKDRGLSDQELFADVLLLTGDIVNREVFISKNPICFGI